MNKLILSMAVAAVALIGSAAQSKAGGWSVGINVGGPVYSSGYYCAPPPVYYCPPRPVYYAPRPVYYQPRPVYYRPAYYGRHHGGHGHGRHYNKHWR